MATTAIKTCTCKHTFQDAEYGKGRRLMNPTKKGGEGPIVYRCTVCNKERT